MQIIDLTTSYLDDFIRDGNRAEYENSFPELIKWLAINGAEALWADYLDENKARNWIDECERETQNLLKIIHENRHETEQKLEIFYTSNPEDIYQFRSGYYIGLKLIDEYSKLGDFTAVDLLKLPRKYFESGICDLISKNLKL